MTEKWCMFCFCVLNIVYTFNGAGDYIYSQTNFVTVHVRCGRVYRFPGTSVIAAIALKDERTGNIVEIWWDGQESRDIVCSKSIKIKKCCCFFCFSRS